MKKIAIIITVSFFFSNLSNAQWQHTNGPFGGTINCMTTVGDTLYAGTDGGVFYSTDKGDSWTKINNGITDSNINTIAVSGSYIYIGTGALFDTGGVYISSNNGKNWKRNYSCPDVSIIAINGNNIYASISNGSGIILSIDHGNTWKNISPNTGIVNSILFHDNDIYLATNWGVYVSSDTGKTWNNIEKITSKIVTSLAIIDTFLFAGTTGMGLLDSYDQGKDWHVGISGLPSNITSLAMSKKYFYAGTDQGVYISKDGGFDWNPVNNGNTLFQNILSLAVMDTIIFAGTQTGGIFKTYDNGLHWTQVNNKFSYYRVNCMIANDSNIFAGTQSGGVFISDKGISKWTPMNNGITNSTPEIQSIELNGSNLYLGLIHSGFYYSSNYGRNWVKKNNYNFLSLKIIGNNLIGGTNGFLFLSTDNGANWKQTDSLIGINSFVQSGSGIFAGGGGKYCIFYSSDSGKTWIPKSIGINKFTIVSSLAISGTNIVAGSNHGIFFSEDNGTNWVKINYSLKDTNIYSVAITGTNIFAATGHGVILTLDKGKNWKYINKGLNDSVVNSLLIYGNNIYAGTISSNYDIGGGIWKRSLSELISGIKNESNIIKTIFVYPNPTKDKLVINISDYKNSKGEIINLNGSILKELNIKSTQTYIDVSGLNNGLYILKITNDKGVTTTKFIKD